MSHQAALATVTAQAQIQLQAAYLSQSEALDSNISTPMLTLPSFDQKSQSTQIVVKTSSSDGYSWRKYGQKQVKSSDVTRSYYRCTNGNCMAKKKVERCPDGREIEITFRGKHNHDPPQKSKYPKEKGIREPCNENETLDTQSGDVNESDLSASKAEHISGNEASEQDCEGDAAIKTAEGKDNEPVPKRRLVENHPPYSAPVLKTIKEPKIVVRSASDPACTSDGYRWRKYGQKLVKGNPNPRSYYRCTNNGCPVRKHVEKSSDDSKSILITYEGKHNHNRPTLKNNDVNLVGDKESMESAETLLSIGTNSSLFSENCAAVPVHNS